VDKTVGGNQIEKGEIQT